MRQLGKRKLFLEELAVASKNDLKLAPFAQMVGNSQAKVIDHSLTFMVAPGATTGIRMTDSSRTKKVGLNNIGNGKPAQNQILLLTAITILGVELGAAPTEDTMAAANFVSIKGLTALQNGEMDLYSDGQVIFKDFPLSNFVTDNDQTIALGKVEVGAPKFIYADSELKCEIRTGVNCHANLVLKVRLDGIATASN